MQSVILDHLNVLSGSGFVKQWNDPYGIIISDLGFTIHIDTRGKNGTQINNIPDVPNGLLVWEKVQFKAKPTNSTKKPYIAISVTGTRTYT